MEWTYMLRQTLRFGFPGLLMIVVCLVGDITLQQRLSEDRHIERALVDSLTHGGVALFAWMLVRGMSFTSRYTLEMLACGILAMVIDIDHFWAARSYQLQHALNLPSRPPLHNTLVVVLLCASLWTVTHLLGVIWNIRGWDFLALLCFVAWFTHHTRDAHRRGFWLGGPFGTTPPLPRAMYLALLLATAVLVAYIMSYEVTGAPDKVFSWKHRRFASPKERVKVQDHHLHLEI